MVSAAQTLLNRGILMAPNALPPLDKLDPAENGNPGSPMRRSRWDRKWAAHLYRRAGFGASRDELREAEQRGPAGHARSAARGRAGAPTSCCPLC